jgi:hypothetical protein
LKSVSVINRDAVGADPCVCPAEEQRISLDHNLKVNLLGLKILKNPSGQGLPCPEKNPKTSASMLAGVVFEKENFFNFSAWIPSRNILLP